MRQNAVTKELTTYNDEAQRVFNSSFDKYKEFSDAVSVLDYLRDQENFPSVRDILTEFVTRKTNCHEHEVVNVLEQLLKQQDLEIGKNRPNIRVIINRWMNGSALLSRESALEVCFTLHLSLEEAMNFIDQIGLPALNIRSAHDAIYMYAFLHSRPLAEANKLIERYNQLPVTIIPASEERYSHSGSTTNIMIEDLKSISWENDDAFFETYIIPNKERFIGYSSTALLEYYKLKNRLYLSVISSKVSDEVYLESQYDANEADVTIDDFKFTHSLRFAIPKHPELIDSSLAKKKNMKDVIPVIEKIVEEADTLKKQEALSDFFNDIAAIDSLLKTIIDAYYKDDNSLETRSFKESLLPDEVTSFFPTRKTFSNFENNPTFMQTNVSVRKSLVLMHYFNYAYSWIAPLSASSEFDDALNFEDYFEQIYTLLTNCRMNPMNPENKFDWLILQSVRHLLEDTDDQFEPTDFFNEILHLSFIPAE